MEKEIYKKTEYGYVLQQRNENLIGILLVIFSMGLISAIIPIVELVSEETRYLNLLAQAVFSVGVFCLGFFFLRSDWRRLVLDEVGVYLHRPLAKTKFIPWEDIRDWGITHQITHSSWVYYLYFSEVPLKAARKESIKKIPMTYKNTVCICVENKDLSSLEKAGVIPFSRQQLISNTKKYPPMSKSSFV